MKVRLRFTTRGWLRFAAGSWWGPFPTAEAAYWMDGFAVVV